MKKKRNKAFFPVPHKALEADAFTDLTPAAAKLLWVLYKLSNKHTNATGWFDQSLRQLQQSTGMTVVTIRRARTELQVRGFTDMYQDPDSFRTKAATMYRIKITVLKAIPVPGLERC